ncbi:hypothetical protein OV450_3164 [Actinobacteria bacterium OV450]|nr:hypothetical protein OV450_3164 [Actinobacteria bacterium OV450]
MVVRHFRDGAGREGIALARIDERRGARLVFDRTTCTDLGSRGLQIGQQDETEPATVVERTDVRARRRKRMGSRGTPLVASASWKTAPHPSCC